MNRSCQYPTLGSSTAGVRNYCGLKSARAGDRNGLSITPLAVWRGCADAVASCVFMVVGLLCIVSLAGCGLPWPFPQPTPDPKLPDAQQVFHPLESGPNAGDVDSLDPGQLQFQFDSGMAQLIFPQLVTLDEKQQPVDWAAASHEISVNG